MKIIYKIMNFIKNKIGARFPFILKYIYTLSFDALPIIMLLSYSVVKLPQYIYNDKFSQFIIKSLLGAKEGYSVGEVSQFTQLFWYGNLVIWLIVVYIIFTISFMCAHARMTGFTYNGLKLERPEGLKNNLFFIGTFLFISGLINFFVLRFNTSDWLYNIIAIYCVQTSVMHLMLKKNAFGHKIVRVKLVNLD